MSIDRGPRPGLDHLNRIFTYMMWFGVMLIVAGCVGVFLLPSGPGVVAAFAIGAGIVMTYTGVRARRRYKAIVAESGGTGTKQ